MDLDLDTARAAFDASTDFTVGLEEEFALLDPSTLGLVPRFEELRDAAAAADPVLAESIAGELISSEIEIRSGRGEDLADALAAQRERRRRLFALAAERASRSARPAPTPGRTTASSTSSTPSTTAASRRAQVRRLAQQHVLAARPRRRARRRPRGRWSATGCARCCPLLLAISANSPFLDGRDSGLHSARTQIFTKSFPRCGVPDAVRRLGRVRRLRRVPGPHALDRRVHAGVVVDPAALRVRDGRGADLRRPGDRGRVRRRWRR